MPRGLDLAVCKTQARVAPGGAWIARGEHDKVSSMMIERESVHFQILERLCSVPKAVRGSSATMLDRRFHADWAVEELASAGLITERGWADGPGTVWVPTAAGEALYYELDRRSA